LVELLLADVRARIAAGEISAARLALHCGCSQPHMCNVLRGRRELSIELAGELQRVLSIDVRELLVAMDAARPVVRWFDAVAA
jgi:antitoxin component HigA of HigAB toxin-antitoxin module